MNQDEFEKRLQRQPLRQVPDEWRAEILRSARSNEGPVSRVEGRNVLSTFFWPNPKAWAGLATTWILIFALHVASRDNAPQLASKETAPSSEIALDLRDQERVLAELIGNNNPPEADRPKRLAPQPHSERLGTTARA